MSTIPLAVAAVNELPLAATPVSTVAPSVLVIAVFALIAAVSVLVRAVQGLIAVAKTVIAPLFAAFTVLVVVTLIVAAGMSGLQL